MLGSISTLEKRVWAVFLALMVTGACLNFTVIFVNGGRMPVNTDELVVSKKHVQMDETSRLTSLADIYPAKIPYVRYATYSIGDVFIYGDCVFGLLMLAGYGIAVLRHLRRRSLN